MKKLLLALALLFAPSLAQAQCNGVFPANTVCGTVAGGVPRAVSPGGFNAGLTINNTSITGGTNTRVLFDNAGTVGEYTNAQLTALIQLATAGLSGAIPAWPNNTTTFFRGDGTYTGITCGALPPLTGDTTSSGCASTFATVNANVGTFGDAANHVQFTVNGKGLITAAASITPAIPFTDLTGQATFAQLPSMGAKTVLSNTTGGSATPLDNSPSTVLDMFSTTQGAILYRDAAAWLPLAPGTAGQLLQSGGAGGNPSWLTASGTGTVTSVANDGSIKSSVASNGAITTSGTLSLWGGSGDITNCTLTGTVAGNALTIALKAQDGNTPSATDPCIVAFRNPTLTIGDYTYIKVTAATTFVTGATGSTFGSTNSTPFRLWVTAWSNAGTIALGASKQSSTTQVFPLVESNDQASTACNACTTASSAGVIYTTASLTTNTIRILGYMDWGSGLATAGVWATGPTTIQLMGPGIRKPGDVVQTTSFNTASVSTTSSAAFVTSNITVNISPTAAPNLVKAWSTTAGHTGAASASQQLQRGSTAIGSTCQTGANATSGCGHIALDLPGTTSATTYAVFFKSASGGTNVVIDDGSIILDEIQG